MGNKNNLAITVISCDKYKDLWDPFFYFFKKNWNDCPYSVYLISNFEKVDVEGVNTICVGEDISWSSNMQIALDNIQEENVLFFVDDTFLNKSTNTEKIEELVNEFINIKANYLKLIPMPKPDKKFNKDFGIIQRGALYRSTAVFSIWKKETLRDLLVEGENAWQFEEFSAERSDKYDGFYSTYKNSFSWIHGVVRGKWISSSAKKIIKAGYPLDVSKRGTYNNISIKLIFRTIRHYIFINIVPTKFRRKVRSTFM